MNPLEQRETFARRLHDLTRSPQTIVCTRLLLRHIEELRECWSNQKEYEQHKDATQRYIQVMLVGLENRARELWFEIDALTTAARTLARLERGRLLRWGDAENRRRKVQDFFNQRRRKYPHVDFGINKLIQTAAEACGVSPSYIKKERRHGRLVIPDKLS